MNIKVLMENTTKSPEYKAEHGLSILIKTPKHKILFDTGASSKFIDNAAQMEEDLKDVDIAVISHGHYDHGGGLEEFLKINNIAKVYINQRAFGDFYSLKPSGEMRYIGLNKELKKSDRIELVGDYMKIDEEIELYSGVEKIEPMPSGNKSLFAKKEYGIDHDDFSHEQNMILTSEGKTLLFAGCAHNGIINIITAYKKLKSSPPDMVLGGFHLYNPTTKVTEDINIIKHVGDELNKYNTKYYTGHCTGDEAYNVLKSILGQKLERLYTGLEERN